MGIVKNAMKGLVFLTFLGANIRPVSAYSLVETLGKVVVLDSQAVVIEVQETPPVRFVLSDSEKNILRESLKKGDRVKIWYSLELKKVDRAGPRGSPAFPDLQEEGKKEAPGKPPLLDDRAFYGA